MQPLNIVHLISARLFVGEAARVVDLAQAQIEAGHHVKLVVRAKMTLANECGRRTMPYESVNYASKFRPWRDYSDVRLIRKTIAGQHADIVHTHRGKDHWLGAWALWGMRSRPLLIRTRHVVTPIKDHLANRYLFNRMTDGVICVSRAVEEVVRRDLSYYRKPIVTIPGGIRTQTMHPDCNAMAQELRERLHIKPTTRILTVLARLASIKGQQYIVQAMPEILAAHPDTVLIIAYPRQSHYRAEIEQEIERLGLRNHVRWLGKLDNVSPLLLLADVGIIASVGSEGWSRVAVESMHLGLPLVSTNISSLPEIVRDNETGLLIPPRDAGAIARAVNRLLGDDDLRARFGTAAIEAAKPYSYTRLRDDMIAFYRELLSRNGRGS